MAFCLTYKWFLKNQFFKKIPVFIQCYCDKSQIVSRHSTIVSSNEDPCQKRHIIPVWTLYKNSSLFNRWEIFLKLAFQKSSNIKNLPLLRQGINRILLFFNLIFSQKYLECNTQYTAIRTFCENSFYPTDGRPF